LDCPAAQASGISKSTVHRLFQAFAVQLHRTRTFKLSNDPFFIEKVRDIVGLYLNPPDNALQPNEQAVRMDRH
jgi:putative transposase